MATFDEAMTPLVDIIDRYIRVTIAAREATRGMPRADSPAMAEINDEHLYRGDVVWGAHPLTTAYSFGRFALIAAEDYLGAACRLLVGNAPSIYAHTVLGRAAIEAAARGYWLLEPGIGVRRRVARAQTERVYSLTQQAAFASAAGKERASVRITAILAEAARLGIARAPTRKNSRRPPELEDPRPGFTVAFVELFRDDDLSDLGRVLAGLFSGIAHSTAFGLTSSVDREALVADPLTGEPRASIRVSSREAGIVLGGCLLGYARAASRAAQLFGWTTEEWVASNIEALSTVRQLMLQVDGNGADTAP